MIFAQAKQMPPWWHGDTMASTLRSMQMKHTFSKFSSSFSSFVSLRFFVTIESRCSFFRAALFICSRESTTIELRMNSSWFADEMLKNRTLSSAGFFGPEFLVCSFFWLLASSLSIAEKYTEPFIRKYSTETFESSRYSTTGPLGTIAVAGG